MGRIEYRRFGSLWFHRKIENKLQGTLGILISRVQLTDSFIAALNKGRRQNVIVIHGDDIDQIFRNEFKFEKYISHVIKVLSYDNIEKSGNEYKFRKTAITDAQFIDELEFSYLNDLEQKINENFNHIIDGWNIVEFQHFPDVFFKPGNFFSQMKKEPSKFLLPDIDSLLAPHITPWYSGHGIMMGYGGTEDIDYHYLALTTEIVTQWRNEAGLHPATKIGNIRGAICL